MSRILVSLLLVGGTVLVSAARGAEIVLDRPSVAVVEARIVESSPGGAGELGIERMLPFLEYFEGSNLPLVVVAVDFEGEVATVVGDRLEGLNRIVFVNPARGKTEVLRQIADSAGASILTPESNWERPAEISTLIGDVASARIAPGLLNLEVGSGGGSVSAGELDSLLGNTDQGGSAGAGQTSYPLILAADTGSAETGVPGQQEGLGKTAGGSLDSILGELALEGAAGEGDFCCQENKSRWMEFRGLKSDQVERLKGDCRKGRWHEGRCPTDRRPWWECVLTVMQQGGVDARYMLWGSDREAEEFCRRQPGVNELNFVH
jgi:hypothetical protein